ncbi:MAG: CRISPR-associated protein Cas4 [candidate division WOR-3 bacterium]
MIEPIDMKITGTQVAYFIICKRKLWLFSHQIEMEDKSELVSIGKLISEESFNREKFKEVSMGDTLKVDFLKINDEVVVHEVKKSRKLEDAHIWQVKFYIYMLRRLGINSTHGIIHYPKLRKKIEVQLNNEDVKQIESAIYHIEEIKQSNKPPEFFLKPYCTKCAYYEFCLA